MIKEQKVTLGKLLIVGVISIGIIVSLSIPLGSIPALGGFLLPGNGVWNVPGEISSYEELTGDELEDDVKVYRDQWGVPHIYGNCEADVMYALGYCHAQDRMFQMDMVRRSAKGLLSEILGPDYIKTDKFSLLKMEYYWANKTLDYVKASTDPEMQKMYHIMQVYSSGVNKYLSAHSDEKPFEYQFLGIDIEPWAPIDTIIFIKYISEYFTWSYRDFTRYETAINLGNANYSELFGFPWPYQIPVCPNYGDFDDISPPESVYNPVSSSEGGSNPINDEKTQIQDFFKQFILGVSKIPEEKANLERKFQIGSNNWVVAGNKTESGSPFLCLDMHLGWTLPPMWSQAHLVTPELNVYALFLAGVCVPVAGHTAYIGWGETIAAYDLMDWYYYNGVNETHYEYKGESVPYETLEITIPVKGQAPETFVINSTVHGPVFTGLIDTPEEFSNNVLACKWSSQNVTLDFLALYGYMHAKNVYEFDNATKYFDMLPLNLAFGDIHGNIGIRPNAKIPIRNDSGIPEWNTGGGSMPYNGSAGQGEWIGYVPFDERPHTINPEQGYLCSANQFIAGPDYPNVSIINSAGAMGYRARRINSFLALNNEMNVDSMKQLQLDVYSVRAKEFTPFLLDAMDAMDAMTDLQQDVYDTLNDWDYIMDKNGVAPTIFNIWNDAYLLCTFQDDMDTLGDFYTPFWTILEKLTKENETSHWFDNITTADTVETRDDIIINALNIALTALEDYYGTPTISEWVWGDIHQLKFTHLVGISSLSAGPYPGSGTGVTVTPAGTRNFRDWEVRWGAAGGGSSERIIVDFGNLNNSLSVLPGGQSGISSSRHYTDQLELFLNGKYHVEYFNAMDLETLQNWAQIESTIIFRGGA
ncbi:MAG: penicillin acylase family protein [Promethearchaeota archaeon]